MSAGKTGKRLRWIGLRVALLVCLMYGILMWYEERFIYFPHVYPSGWWDRVEMHAERFTVDDVWLTTEDNVRIHGWYATPVVPEGQENADQRKVLLWMHGNGGNITHRLGLMEIFAELPVDMLLMDYRGYGKSEGRPSEQGLYRDATAAWEYLTQARGIAPERIILFGESLGGAVVTELAARVPAGGLVVMSTFTSVPDVARIRLPFMPSFLIRTRMNTIEHMPKIKCPKLIVHGDSDYTVPFRMGRALYEAAAEPKRFLAISGAGHNDIQRRGNSELMEEMRVLLTMVDEAANRSASR